MLRVFFLLTLLVPPAMAVADTDGGTISGVVRNGSEQGRPLAGAEVVLRAGRGGELQPIATATSDSAGKFAFTGLATDGQTIFLPGANHHGVHFPGSRVRLGRGQTAAEVQLVAYDSIESPSPLVARRHEFSIRVETGYLEVAESLLIENPSLRTYVGESPDDRPAVTLRLHLPEGFETVTFEKEFYGRSFMPHTGRLITDLPWPPGTRELKYAYRLPIEKRSGMFRRALDLPTDAAAIRVAGNDLGAVHCNLPASGESLAFASETKTLPAGHEIELRMGDLPVRWEVSARWFAAIALGLLLLGTIAGRRWRQRSDAASIPKPRRARRAPGQSRRGSQVANTRR